MADKALTAPKCLLDLNYSEIKATHGRGKSGMAFHRVSLEGRPIKFLLMPLGEFAHVPWKPSVYQGDGTENRVNIQFKVSDAQREALETIEESIRDQLGIHASAWNSSVKPDAEGGTLKCKLNLQGPKACQVSGASTTMPSNWPQRCNAFISLSTVYQQARAAGLLFEVNALDIGPPEAEPASNPFTARYR